MDGLLYEPDVALTDYGLALECLLFAWLLSRRRAQNVALRRWFQLFFLALAAAAAAGGTLHGFLGDSSTVGYRALWKATLIAMGAVAFAA